MDGNPHVFIGGRKGKGLSSAAMSELLKGMGYEPERATVHGFRSTFKDWATETTAYPGEVSEMALAHVVKDKTEAAYRRGELFEKRRRLMADWATFCALPPRGERTVVPIRRALCRSACNVDPRTDRDGYDSCPVTSVAAADVEGAELDHVQKLLVAPELVARA